MYIVYKHINKIKGKVYIGQTVLNVERRWRNSKGYKTGVFKKAIEKQGWNNFEHIIVRDKLSKEEANLLEISLIRKYKELGICYNITDGGEGACGYKHTEESKKKISNRSKGKKIPEYIKILVSERFKGVALTEEHKLKISNTLKKNNAGKIHFNKGRKHSEEYREKCRARSLGENNPNWGNGEKIKGEKNPMYGKKHSEETRRKMREKAKTKVFNCKCKSCFKNSIL